jgi:hypothetical protein
MDRVLRIAQPPATSHRDSFGMILSAPERVVRSLFECWHRRMSWPITRDGQTYRTCVKCGVRRNFDPKTWKSVGSFYRRN